MKRSAYLALSLLPLFAGAWVQGERPREEPIARLRREIAEGRSSLKFEPGQGYLRSLLKELKIDPSSQTLVFSKTSLQSDFITRKTPRALYFNEDTYVGWIPGAPLIEIMSVHPTRGVVFTTIPNEAPAETPILKAETEECIRCHGGSARLFATSVATAPSGYPRVTENSYDVTPSLPLRRRWGGWYVTGRHGGQRHMGNVLSLGTDEKSSLDIERGANVTDLSPYLDTSRYLSPGSDIAALMVMEAQMDVQNAIARTARLARGVKGKEEIAEACEPLVEALLGCDEVRLTSPVTGDGEFARVYSSSGPKDRQGRSLTELDLRTRLLRISCSPLVYSASFDALPNLVQDQIWRRFREILSGADPERRFGHLSPADRVAIREVLIDTKPAFARFLAAS